MAKKKSLTHPAPASGKGINEDWLSVGIAFLLIVLAAIGILGKNGINITF